MGEITIRQLHSGAVGGLHLLVAGGSTPAGRPGSPIVDSAIGQNARQRQTPQSGGHLRVSVRASETSGELPDEIVPYEIGDSQS
jgi:hypothetical protein